MVLPTLTDQNSAGWLLGTSAGVFVFAILLVWSGIFQAIAMWKAARRGETAWYIILLLIHTLGILDIIYIYAVAKEEKKK